jgi:S1-C subfamily serine protease
LWAEGSLDLKSAVARACQHDRLIEHAGDSSMRAVLTGLVTAGACLVTLWTGPAPAYERPWLGTYVGDAPAPKVRGASDRWTGAAVVVKVQGPAASAGMQIFDVIVEVDGEPIAGSRDLTCRIAALAPGASVRFTVVRELRRVQLTATLGRWPERDQADRPPPGCATDLLG